MSPLKVYKASAGSGKTFALTLGYLELLFRAPDAYRHILAVTFTNKAAGEMKDRILSRLQRLSLTSDTAENEDLHLLVERTGLDKKEIISRSGDLLKAILNNYSRFSVGTIDKFFQSVIRAFTREIGIQPGYNLELDHHRVLALGIDTLFQDIAHQKELQQWLIRFAEERMDESRSWNFRRDIDQLGMQLFTESFQELFTDPELVVLGKDNLNRYREDLKEAEKKAREKMLAVAREALAEIEKNDLETGDFRGKGNSPPNLFAKALENGEVSFTKSKLEALEQIEKWLNKDASPQMASLTKNVLMPRLQEVYNQQVELNTISAIRQNFYTLGILGDIRAKVQDYLKGQNLFLIADSSRFLRGIIGANQVPFVYERTGNRYHHIMLDEFQDTSIFQYENFRPLLDNALASGNENLVVGDVKQSIYRWRNSDWRILSTQLKADFSHQHYREDPLDQNFRSREQIIRFNNSVFQLAPEVLADVVEGELEAASVNREEVERAANQFRNAYADAVQQIPDRSIGTGGMVRVGFFGEEGEISFRDQVLEVIPDWIDEIQQSGIEPGEIAILVRSRKEGVMLAGRLLEHARTTGEGHRYRLISSESLLLSQNDAVSLVISAMQYLVRPEDELNNALLKYRCFLLGRKEERITDPLFDVSVTPEQFLPDDFMASSHLYRQMPLFELVEVLIRQFGLDHRQEDLPYLQAFQDLVIELHRRESPGIPEFLNYWEQHGSRKGIQVSENSNAIRILTIHRAKGLEFKAVLVPFCNWEITTDQRKSNIIWCRTEGTPFNRIPVVPLRYKSSMEHTRFSGFYYQERMKGYLDSLNLMYVAFTRAVDVLYLGVPEPEGNGLKSTGDLFRSLMDLVPGRQPALHSLGSYRSGDTLTIGQMPEYESQAAEEHPWKFTSYAVNPGHRRLKLRMRSDEYFVDEEGLFRTDRAFGNTMHMVFSRIRTINDVIPAMDRLEREGVLPVNERPDLEQKILELISMPGADKWFTEAQGREVYNEKSILCGDGMVVRPDRVIVDRDGVSVVDFKFGKQEKEYYRDQVVLYMDQLGRMGYGRVKGFIWYVMLEKIVQIEQP